MYAIRSYYAPISHEDITKYVSRVFEDLNNDQIRDIINNEFLYIRKIKDKVKELENEYAKEQFQLLLDTNNIMVKPSFKFPPELTHINLCSPINKSLYEREASVNNFEQKVIMDIASLENVLFWHRNLEKGKGFALNGFKNDHYPDFIIYTQNGNLILIETKGDHLDNDVITSYSIHYTKLYEIFQPIFYPTSFWLCYHHYPNGHLLFQ